MLGVPEAHSRCGHGRARLLLATGEHPGILAGCRPGPGVRGESPQEGLSGIAAPRVRASGQSMGQDPIGANGRIQNWFANHKLDKLAQRARVTGFNEDLLHQLTEFITAGKYPVGLEDGAGARAQGYFPDTVLAGVEATLPVLEERLAAVPSPRDRRAKVDLLELCAGQRKGSKRARKDA